MNYQLSLRREAMEDMAEAESFYEAEVVGLSDRFRDQVALTLRQIQENPRSFPYSDKPPYRKAVVDVFPFCIYYCVLPRKIIIIAVHDARRNPERWQSRVK